MTTTQEPFSAKLVWFNAGPAWTCQKENRHVITIHWGDNDKARKLAEETAARLNKLFPVDNS